MSGTGSSSMAPSGSPEAKKDNTRTGPSLKACFFNTCANKKRFACAIPSKIITGLAIIPNKLGHVQMNPVKRFQKDPTAPRDEVADHDPSSFPPPPPSVLMNNPGIVCKRRRHFQKKPQKEIRKSLPKYPLDVFFDYNSSDPKNRVHLRNLRIHKLLGKELGRDSRNFYSLRILRPEMDDTSMKSLYRMYEYVVVDDRSRLRQEIEYFYNMTHWEIANIEDPLAVEGPLAADEGPFRCAILAAIAELLVRAFNVLFDAGLRRDANVWTATDKNAMKGTRLNHERVPEWVQHVPALPERFFLPDVNGDMLLAAEDDPQASPEFLKYNIIRKRPVFQFRYFKPKGTTHRPSKKVLTDAGHGIAETAAKVPPAVSKAVVGTGKSTAHGVATASKWTGEKAVHAVNKGKKTGKHCLNKEAIQNPGVTAKKLAHIWTTGTKGIVRADKQVIDEEGSKEDGEGGGNDKLMNILSAQTDGTKQKVVHRLARDVYLTVVSYGAA